MELESFRDAAAAAKAASEALADRLRPSGARTLMVTGGSSPGPVYDLLARMELEWARVTVTLSDDRFVPSDSPDSNERLVRGRLLVARAAAARFAPLKGPGPTPDDDARAAEPRIRPLVPFDAALLGMGGDGHVASLFPGAPGLVDALDPTGDRYVIGVATAGLAPFVPRISLAGRALMGAGLTIVLISGETKRVLIERVFADEAFAPPVAALVRRPGPPVRILWSPG